MKTIHEIEEILKNHKTALIHKYKVKGIGVFGSHVRGEQSKKSDIDILVEFEHVPDLLTFLEMERYLEKLLGCKVDLIEKTSLRPRIKESILREVDNV
jgi:predicted nucleotidyltransferase